MIHTQRRAPHIAIIGGGLAGLECALSAAERGCRVEIFEAGPSTRARHVYWDRRAHPGDEKTRSWSCEGWGPGGGLSERLGGRSLCYHGVLLEIEPPSLSAWGPAWQARLSGQNGLYASVLARLRPHYPELTSDERGGGIEALGLVKAPQAARLDSQGRFEAYSPLTDIMAGGDAGRFIVTRGRALAVSSTAGKVAIELDAGGERITRSGFDACILSASAIGNVQILARSLGRDIQTKITDHFCVGVFLRLPPGAPLAAFRHPMLWHGFTQSRDLGANIFVLERPAFPNGERLIEIMAVVEQQGGAEAFSDLAVTFDGAGAMQTNIQAQISELDRARLDRVLEEVTRWAETLAGCQVEEVAPRGAGEVTVRSGKHDGSDSRWFGHDAALAAVEESHAANVYSRFELPYGAFEHEGCTHPIGGTGALAVSQDLEVGALPGVHVAGPGVFPRLGVANPALTILATSRWLGGHLAKGGRS